MKRILPVFVLFCCTLISVEAQEKVDSTANNRLHSSPGIVFRRDTTMLLHASFRVQNMVGYTTENLQQLKDGSADFAITRARLRFDGFALGPKLTYILQFNFSRTDMDPDQLGEHLILRDAMVWYEVAPGMKWGVGQGKLPGNRQRNISSGALEFIDRSIASNAYNLDRDAGIFVTQQIKIKRFYTRLYGAFTSGEGRYKMATNDGISSTGKIEFYPLGLFNNQNDYEEGDLYGEPTPKIALSFTGHYNDKAIHTLGQTGALMSTPRYLHAYMGDLLFKYNGFSLSAEYLSRYANNPFNEYSKPGNFVLGSAYNAQMSFCFEDGVGLALRYAKVMPDRIFVYTEPQRKQYALCLTRYFNGHRIKLQTEIQFNELAFVLNGKLLYPYVKQYAGGFVQIEFGI